MGRLGLLSILLLPLVLSGCAEVALSAGSMVAGAAANHTLGGINYKTFAAPMPNVRLATLKTLSRMDMEVARDEQTDEGWEFEATASDRSIDITLEQLTKRTTRMRVVATEGIFFFMKDSATATEIIVQVAEALDRDMAVAAREDMSKQIAPAGGPRGTKK
ncbi:MAG: DUF3568 family protein [Alphaproteobacteria bacterium]